MRLINSIATIGFYTIASRLFGFFRSTMQAAFLGAGVMSDAFVIAVKFPSMLRRIFAEGAFNAAFVPMVAGIFAKEGTQAAKSYAEEVFSLLVLILGGIVIIVELFMPQIMSSLVSGFSETPERLALTITYSRITFPFIFFISICALYSGLLNSLEKFAAAAASPMFGNMAIITVSYLLMPVATTTGQAFSWGVMMCGIVQALVVIIPAYKQGMFLRFRWPKLTPEMRKFFVLLGPALIGSGVVQVNIFIDMIIGSYLPTGSVSYLEYADRINQLPLSVIGVAMGTALLPLLSKQIRLKEFAAAHNTQNLALEYSMTLVVPAMIGLFVLAHPIVETVFAWGKLTPNNIIQIAHTLQAFCIGLPAYIMIKIFSTIFFAHKNTKTPVITAACSVAANFVINLMVYKYYAHTGLAAATATAAWLNAVLLLILLIKQKYFKFSSRFQKFIPKLIFVTIVCALSVYGLQDALWEQVNDTKLEQIVSLIILITVAIIFYILTCFMVGIYKYSDLKKVFKSKGHSVL